MLFEKAIVKKFREAICQRYDPDGTIFYYSPEDLGLLYTEFNFKGDHGQILRGYFYGDGIMKPDRLIIFEHGMGCGHRAYLREIATIVNEGYQVFAYDHTGTLASEGTDIGGFSQSLSDLDHALRAIKASYWFLNQKITVIGHSWGGFSTLNIPAYHPDIDSVVAISGYVSVYEMLRSILGPMKIYSDALLRAEAEKFGAYSYADARYSLSLSSTHALIVHSKDDSVCPFSHFELLRSTLGEKEGVLFLECDKKDHNPNYTRLAIIEKAKFFKALAKMKKQKKLSTDEEKAAFLGEWDFAKITEQDKLFWEKVFDFIDPGRHIMDELEGFGVILESETPFLS